MFLVNIHVKLKLQKQRFIWTLDCLLYELNKSPNRDLDKDLKVFDLASSKQINESFLEIEEMLIRVGYLLKHTSRAKISKFKKYILRANTSIHEMNILRGIVHQINWFLNNSKSK